MNKIRIPSSITIGPIDFHIYGLLLGIGFAIIYFAISKRYKNQLKTVDYLLCAFLAILGARSLFIIHNFTHFVSDPLYFFRISSGGLALYGAFTGLVVGIFYVSRRRKIHFLKLTDEVFTYVPLVQAIGRLGNFVNQELYGRPTESWWGIFIDEDKRLQGYEDYSYFQPTFLIEAILNIVNFLILKYLLKNQREGVRTSIFLFNYGIIRLLVNRVRIDKEYFGAIETSDLFSMLLIILSLILLSYLYSSELKRIFRL